MSLEIIKSKYKHFLMVKDIYLVSPHRLIRRIKNIIISRFWPNEKNQFVLIIQKINY